MSEPQLKTVPEEAPEGVAPEVSSPASPATSTPDSSRPRGWLIGLGLALALTLGLLVWSRVELSRTTADFEARIGALEHQVSGLEGQLVQRESVISAQRDRLTDVRRSVGDLQRLLEEPLPR